MTEEIEKKFFDTFGIKPKPNESGYGRCLKYDNLLKCESEKKDLMEGCPGCEYFEVFKFYPTITNRILLELIEIIINRDFDILKLYKVNGSYHGQFDTDIDHYFAHYQKDTLKDLILDICQHNYRNFYHQVRALFGESEEKCNSI